MTICPITLDKIRSLESVSFTDLKNRSIRILSERAMNVIRKTLMLTCMSLVAGSAFAAPHLTQQQCHGYPFVKTAHPATHRQLMNELGELEAVGYEPEANNHSYPSDVIAGERRLQAEYRQDCLNTGKVAQNVTAPTVN